MPTTKKPTARVITGDAAVIEKLKFILSCKGRDFSENADKDWVVGQIDNAFHRIKERIDLGPSGRRKINEERRIRSAEIDRYDKDRGKREKELQRRAYSFEVGRPAAKGGVR